jgi:UDP-2-acetamido-2-deoxy-ribo-hexuluronate aminotransferase
MDFIDLKKQQQRIKENIDARIQAVLAHGQYIMGPEVQELEHRLAEYVGQPHAVGCASGTDALLLTLLAYDIGPGDAVFTTPFTFVATAEVISLLGATPIFVDIDSKTFNIDPAKFELAIQALKSNDPTIYALPRPLSPKAEGRKPNSSSLDPLSFEAPTRRGLRPGGLSALSPRAIISVDLFGLPADYDEIKAKAQKHNLVVIEDAAQSFGAEYKGKKACALSGLACTSFFPAKPLGGYGDGGMCFTDDQEMAQKWRSLRNHGQGRDKYENIRIGINGRLDTMQAAILLAKFEIFPEEMELRQQVAMRYNELLLPLASSGALLLPQTPGYARSVWAQYSVLAQDEASRSFLQARLKTAGIPTAVYYPKPLHLQEAFNDLGYQPGDFPVSEDCAKRIFSLPMHPYLKFEEQKRIIEGLKP